MSSTLQALYAQRKLSEIAIQKIEEIRSSPPARRVGSNGHNVRVRYASKKMGFTIQAESHTVELPAIVIMESDPDVFEFYDQPTTLKLTYSHPSKKKRCHLHTPDFFVISKSFIGFEEWKALEQLKKISAENPFRYNYLDGTWICPPGIEAAKKLGLEYRVRTDHEINPVFYRNILLLEDYFSEISVNTVVREKILDAIREKSEISLDKLIGLGESGSVDTVYRMIATGEIYVDLEHDELLRPRNVRVFRDESIALALRSNDYQPENRIPLLSQKLNAGMSISWDGNPWVILNIGLREISLANKDSQVAQLPNHAVQDLLNSKKIVLAEDISEEKTHPLHSALANAHPENLKQAQKRLDAIRAFLDAKIGEISSCPNGRTMRRWIKQYKDAEMLCGFGFVGLLSKVEKRGNRLSRLPEKTKNLIYEVIETDHLTTKKKNVSASYAKLKERCEAELLDVPSYRTFGKAIMNYSVYERTIRRSGKKAAYKYKAQSGRSILRHYAVRPFEIAYLDHTEIDLETVSEYTGKPIGRAWLTLMIDDYTRIILAFYLTYDVPSYRACMIVIRECVRRNNRLPDCIMVDNGKEFESVYFETLLARCGVHKKNRPPGQPKYGSPNERMFGTTNTSFVNNLLGNTQATKNVREMTRDTDPKRIAVWTFPALHEMIEAALYKYYENRLHSFGATPREMFDNGIAKTGIREVRYISYDRNFFLLTLPSTRKGTARVQPGNGVKINYLYYWCDGLRNPELEYQQVPVKYDPLDISTAYVHIHGVWTECKSEYAYFFVNKNEQLLRAATAEIHRLRSIGNHRLQINASSIMQQIQEIEATESLLIERLKAVRLENSKPKELGTITHDTEVMVDESPVTEIPDINDLPILEDF